MKKIVFFHMMPLFWAMAACMMVGCGSKTGQAVSSTDTLAVDTVVGSVVDKHSEAYIRQRIDTIYKTVGKRTYDAEGHLVDYIHSRFNRDSAYCSERYYALMQQALKVCDETGDILYDYDHWICGQDFSDDWSCKVAKVYQVTDTTALVDLTIHNFSNSDETTIALRFERDDWYIDDFSPSASGDDDKAYLRRMIKEGRAAHEKAKTLAGDWGWVDEDSPELLLDMEMTDKGLRAKQCDVYRMYGFDHTTITFDGEHLTVNQEADDETPENHLYLYLHLDQNGDLVGDCTISHRLASKSYDGPIRLRKGYFYYRDK